jgi:uncharacterized protein
MNRIENSVTSYEESSTYPHSDKDNPQVNDSSSWYKTQWMLMVGPIFRQLGFLSGYEHQLMEAIATDSADDVAKLCRLGADYNTTSFHRYGYTFVMFAVECGAIESLKKLIKMGADVNQRSASRDKVTALFFASRNKTPDPMTTLRVLLQNGAKPNLAVKGGVTPLIEVSFQGNEQVIQELVKYGAELNLIDHRKNTALDLAIQRLGPTNPTVRTMISLGAKRFKDLDEQVIIVQPKLLFSSEGHGQNERTHCKINPKDIFKSGFLLPNQTLKKILDYRGMDGKIKKYDERFPSLFRSVIRGRSDYILYDSHAFFTTCEGCLNGVSPTDYLGKGGEAKVKVAQVAQTGEFVAVRISETVSRCEIDLLRKMGLLIEYVCTNDKHYSFQTLLHGDRLEDYFGSSSFRDKNAQEQYKTIKKVMMQLLEQLHRMHNYGCLHRDLASNNIIVDPEKETATIIDFGKAVKEPNFWNGYIDGQVTKFGLGMAPELNRPTICGYFPYSQQTDIYALGSILRDILYVTTSDQAKSQGGRLCQQMMAETPAERQAAAYYLEIIKNW